MQPHDPFAAAPQMEITPIIDTESRSPAGTDTFSERQKQKAERSNRWLTIAGVTGGVIVLIVLVLAVILGGSDGTLDLDGDWQQVKPSANTVAQFPATPREKRTEGDQPRTVYTSIVGEGAAVFGVEARAMELQPDREAIKQALDTVRDSLNTNGKVQGEQDIWLNHYPGRIFHADVKLGSGAVAQGEIRIFLDPVHDTVYFVQVLQTEPCLKPSDVQRFFEAFKFTKDLQDPS